MAAPRSEFESVRWLAEVNASNGWPWDLAMMLAGYALLRCIELVSRRGKREIG